MANDSPGAAPVTKYSIAEAGEIAASLAEESLDLGYCESDRLAFERASRALAAALRVVKAAKAYQRHLDPLCGSDDCNLIAALNQWEE